jgi:soluble lytic murein transglycosylase
LAAIWLPLALLPAQTTLEGAGARLKAAVESIERGQTAPAIAELQAVRSRFPAIADYLGYWLAQAYAAEKNWTGVLQAVAPVWTARPESPLAGRAAVLAGSALLELQRPAEVPALLERVAEGNRQQPESFALAARALEQTGDLPGAAAYWQKVYTLYPVSTQAGEASTALARLRGLLGARFPVVRPEDVLERAARLTSARQHARARQEYLQAAATLSGLYREQAQVRAAAAEYAQRRNAQAIQELEALSPSFEEANAERLYWLALSYRRAERVEGVKTVLAALERKAPLSPWRQKALVQAANSFLVQNDYESFTPLYQACADDFASMPESAYCHWNVAWRAYLQRQADAQALLREHLKRYPASEKAGAALYYLGRLAERAGDRQSAAQFWKEARTRFPNSYYGVLSRGLDGNATSGNGGAASPAELFLRSIEWPERERAPDFSVSGVTASRIQRARVLAQAGLETWAELEMRFGARTDSNPWPLALELARTATKRGAPAVALRHIKGTVPGYLYLPRDAAPKEFWKFAFPWPYRARIERHARERNLDPFLVAALIRQESEFDPSARSSANAMGLMQVMPATGRELSRKTGVQPFRTPMLYDPEVSIRLGTYYLRAQLDRRAGSVEDTLAAYNAGPTRIPRWRGWADFQEPSEFVETIPLQQTRDYVQIIWRNADVYRWLYAGEPAVYEPEPPATKPAAAAAKPAVRKATPKKTEAKAPAPQAVPRKAPAKKGSTPVKPPARSK